MLKKIEYKESDLPFSYHALRKIKGRWVCVAEFKCNAFSCSRNAELHFQHNGIDAAKYRIVGGSDWQAIQVRQHLKDAGLLAKAGAA